MSSSSSSSGAAHGDSLSTKNNTQQPTQQVRDVSIPMLQQQLGGYSMDQNQQYYNPFQTMSMNTNPEQYMQMQMQYQMQLQQMQQMQHAGAVQQGTADMMVVQNNINSSNPYGGMIQNPYFNFGMQMPTSSTMQMIPGMQMMQMPGLQMVPRTMSNPSLQQMDGSSVATSCGIQARVEVTNSGMSAMAPSNTQQMQSFDPVASTATANPYPYYPYIPPVNPYMYMGMGGMGEAPYDPYKVLGKYAPVSGLPYGVMTPFNNPSPAGMNPKPQPPGSSSSHTIAQNNIDKLTPPEVDAANSSVLVISWITILEEFDKRYDVVFESCSAKIHLDTSKTIIDGAKGRWRHVTLLDTLIAYGLGRERSKEDCERRRFNQYLALQEAVCFACAEALIWHSTELFSKGDKSTSSTVNPYMCTVTDIPQAWSTTENLKMDLLHQSSKSWKKRKDAVEILCKQWLVLEIGLHILITSVVNRIYNQHYVNPCCRANRNRNNKDLVEETDAALFDFCQTVTADTIEAEKNKETQADSKLKRKR